MKKDNIIKLIVGVFCLYTQSLTSQTLGVSGKYITKNGSNIILRGINYPFIDDGTSINPASASSYEYYLNEASKTGANVMRVAWYTPGTHWRDVQTSGTLQGYIQNGHLSNIFSYIKSKNMVVLLDIHNATCSNDWNYFNNTVIPYWTSTAMLSLIQAHQDNLIINICNEFGNARWTGDVANAMNIFKTNYKNAITSLRNAGIQTPLMIDAPDCGTSSTELLSVAQELQNHDPMHKIIFSAHAYWGSYAPTTPNIETKLSEMTNSGLCWFIGEVAPNQDDNGCGNLDLTTLYPTLLTKLCQREIGWTAWTYDQDCSATREMTTDGKFSNLTTFGNDIVNNVNYGLKSGGGCQAALLESVKIKADNHNFISPTFSTGNFSLKNSELINQIVVLNDLGQIVEKFNGNIEQFSLIKSGIYFVKIEFKIGKMVTQRILVQKD